MYCQPQPLFELSFNATSQINLLNSKAPACSVPLEVYSNKEEIKTSQEIKVTLNKNQTSSVLRKAESLYTVGRQHQEQGELEEAINTFKQCIQLNRTLFCAYQALSECFSLTGQPLTAIKVLESYIQVAPQQPEAYYALYAACKKLSFDRPKQKTLWALKKYIEMSPTSEISADDYLTLAQAQDQRIYKQATERYYLKAYERSPKDSRVILKVVDYYYGLADYSSAVIYLEKFIDLTPAHQSLKYKVTLIRVLFMELRDFKKVVEIGTKFIKKGLLFIKQSELKQLYHLISLACSELNRVEEAFDWHIINIQKTSFCPEIGSKFFRHRPVKSITSIVIDKFKGQQFQSAKVYVEFGRLFHHFKQYTYALEAFEKADRLAQQLGGSVRAEIDLIFGREGRTSHTVHHHGNIFGGRQVNNTGNIFGGGRIHQEQNTGNIFGGGRNNNIFGGGGNIFAAANQVTDNNAHDLRPMIATRNDEPRGIFGGRGGGNVFGGPGPYRTGNALQRPPLTVGDFERIFARGRDERNETGIFGRQAQQPATGDIFGGQPARATREVRDTTVYNRPQHSPSNKYGCWGKMVGYLCLIDEIKHLMRVQQYEDAFRSMFAVEEDNLQYKPKQ